MSQFHLKFLLNSLNDEPNLVQALPTLIPSILSITGVDKEEASLTKLHTRLSALLQAKDVGLRWSAVCLVKSILERPVGRWETLMSHGSTWMKLLLKILERENNEALIERSTSTIRLIIRMTEGKPSLTRDLTTPSLPTFFTHIFNILAKPHFSHNLIKNILYHIQSTLVTHPTTFRPFANKLQSLSSGLLNGSCTDPELLELAARCFASLHLCAPKNTAAEQWTTGLLAVMGECHATLSYILQPVVAENAQLVVPDGLAFLPFTSDYASQVPLAMRRLEALSAALHAFITLPTKDVVKVPMGQLIMLITRLFDITQRSGIKASTPQTSQVTLVSFLPQIHKVGLDLTRISFEIFGKHVTQHVESLQHLVLLECFGAQDFCREAAIAVLSTSIRTCGFVESGKAELLKTVRACVEVLASTVPRTANSLATTNAGRRPGAAQGHQKKRKHAGTNEGSDQISHDSAFHQRPSLERLGVCVDLLETVLTTTHGILSRGTRQQIDVTVLRLLTADAAELEDGGSSSTVRLLHLLKASLFAPEPSFAAAALLSAGINTVSKYVGSADPGIRHVATRIRDELEVFIHPRFPALRRRVVETADEREGEEEDEDRDDNLVGLGERDGRGDDGTVREVEMVSEVPPDSAVDGAFPRSPARPAFAMPDAFPKAQSPQKVGTLSHLPTEPAVASEPQEVGGSAAAEPVPKRKKIEIDALLQDDDRDPYERESPSSAAGGDEDEDEDDEDMDAIPEICTDLDTDEDEEDV